MAPGGSWPGQPPAASADQLEKIVDQLGLHWDVEALTAVCEHIDDLARSGRPAPFAAAAIAAHVVAMQSDAELFAWRLADLVLAQNLRWPRPLPLLMAHVFGPAFRSKPGGGKRIRPGEKGFERAVCLALAQAAADACRLAAELSRRAKRLIAVAPKLRAKGGGRCDPKTARRRRPLRIADDQKTVAVCGAAPVRAAAKLEALRELTGRASFRLFGL
ncbi:DUF1403 family protein [Mesorhizobium sp. M0296]